MRIAALVLCTLLTAGSALSAQLRTERKWPLAPDGAVKIYNFVGRIHVVGWDRDTVAVSASLPANYHLFGGGERTAVKLGVDGDDGNKQTAVVLEVRVPLGANVWVRGASTDIDVSGLIGTVDIGTVSGRVVVTGSPRMLTAESMTGALQVRGSPETLRARTAAGNLSWDGSARDALLVSVSGMVRVASGPIERLRVESVTGAVRIDAALRANALVTIETHSGDVELRVPARAPLRLDADAAMVTAPGVAPRLRPDGRFAGPTTYDYNITKPPSPAPTVVVRSFTGRLVLAVSR